MDYLQTTSGNTDTIKSLWKRKEGKFAKVLAVLLGGGILFGLYKLLPFLIALAANTITLIVELVVLVILLYVLTNKDTWQLLQLLWLQLTRKIYGIFVNIDPIAVLKNGIKEMKEKLQIVSEQVTKLQGVLEGMKKNLELYKETFEVNVRKRKALTKKLNGVLSSDEVMRYTAEAKLLDNDITRGEKQIKSQMTRIETSEKYLNVMKKLEFAANFKVTDAENELKYREEEEFKQAKAQSKAMGSITSILKSGLETSIQEELALESVNSTINNSLAEMSRLLDGSNDILTNFELNTEANSEKAAEILLEFDKNGFDIFTQKQDSGWDNKSIGRVLLPEPNKEPIFIERGGNDEQDGSKYFN